MMERWAKVLTKKTTIAVLTVMIITTVLIASNVQASTNASATPAGGGDGPWAKRATWALKKARHEIDGAINKIMEQAERGANVTLAKGVLKASIRIYGAAERFFGEGHYKKAFFTAVLSGLIARDSARVAEDPKAIDAIMDEVEEKLDQVKEYIEDSGVDVGPAHKVLERAEKLYTKAEELMKEKPVRALVAAEISRILAHVAERIAQRSQ